ncbi:LysR family transcriptional regulator [Paracidovorax anthurii]|nr:LysR family transcriptional regulator [Paracidovorax anthurii]
MEVFRAVMLTGSVKGAASLLCMSQPAVSRAIAHTEQTIGFALFQRTKGRLAATQEAQALIGEVEAFYRHAIQVNDFAANLRNGSAGTLTIYTSHCLSRGLVSRAIVRFLANHPKVHVQLRACVLADLPSAVVGNKADLGVAVLPLDHVHLHVQRFTEGRMVCVMPTDHPLANAEAVSFADLAAHPTIAPHPSIAFGQMIATALQKAGVTLDSRIDIHHMDVACALVRAGAGVAIVDEFTVEGLGCGDLRMLPLAEEIVLTPAVLRSTLCADRPYVKSFVAALTEQARIDRISTV